MVTVLLKKRNRQQCLKHFPPTNVKMAVVILIFGGIAVVFCALLRDEKASAACSKPLFCIITLHVIVNALFTAVTCYQ